MRRDLFLGIFGRTSIRRLYDASSICIPITWSFHPLFKGQESPRTIACALFNPQPLLMTDSRSFWVIVNTLIGLSCYLLKEPPPLRGTAFFRTVSKGEGGTTDHLWLISPSRSSPSTVQTFWPSLLQWETGYGTTRDSENRKPALPKAGRRRMEERDLWHFCLRTVSFDACQRSEDTRRFSHLTQQGKRFLIAPNLFFCSPSA